MGKEDVGAKEPIVTESATALPSHFPSLLKTHLWPPQRVPPEPLNERPHRSWRGDGPVPDVSCERPPEGRLRGIGRHEAPERSGVEEDQAAAEVRV